MPSINLLQNTLIHQLGSYGLMLCLFSVFFHKSTLASYLLALYRLTEVDYFSKNLSLCSTEGRNKVIYTTLNEKKLGCHEIENLWFVNYLCFLFN